MPRQKLTREMKARIVTLLAVLTPPSEVRDTLEKEFGVKVPVTSIVYYDASSSETRLAKEYKDLFNTTREKYFKDVSKIPIAHEAYRLRKLQETLEREETRENTVGVRETLEQAAKEVGGAFTNKRELTGKDGSALVPTALTVNFVKPGTGNAGS